MISLNLKQHGLTVLGGFHPANDSWFEDCQTVLMIGPDEPRFWPHFITQPEYLGGQSDAMDRYSKRVLNQIAKDLDGLVFFPSDGPPYPPFIQWALRSGCHQSPVGLLVHGQAGLFASFRGALALKDHINIPAPEGTPCPSCTTQPCRTACPIGALTPEGYDVAACKAYVRSPLGKPCRSGCKVRLSCPVSQKFGRVEAQSEFHMKAFLST